MNTNLISFGKLTDNNKIISKGNIAKIIHTNLTGERVKILRYDNGKEYLNNRFYKFAQEKGIILNNCPACVHELNGTAERFNRMIMDMARCY